MKTTIRHFVKAYGYKALQGKRIMQEHTNRIFTIVDSAFKPSEVELFNDYRNRPFYFRLAGYRETPDQCEWLYSDSDFVIMPSDEVILNEIEKIRIWYRQQYLSIPSCEYLQKHCDYIACDDKEMLQFLPFKRIL